MSRKYNSPHHNGKVDMLEKSLSNSLKRCGELVDMNTSLTLLAADIEAKLKIAVEALKMYASLRGSAMHWPNHDRFSYPETPAIEALTKIETATLAGDKE